MIARHRTTASTEHAPRHLSAEEVNIQIRRQLVAAINQQIDTYGWTQAEAARHLGVKQPRISHLVSSQVERFSIDALLQLASRAGIEIEIGLTPPRLDEPGFRPE